MKILITGGAGFVGRQTVRHLAATTAHELMVSVRRQDADLSRMASVHVTGEINEEVSWSTVLAGVDVVIHAAARVHVMNDAATDPIAEFRKVNVAGTLSLARQAAAAGVRRFIFLSSIKVNGEGTEPGRPYTADAAPAPADSYGISKMEAEQGLRALSAKTGMEVVIIRPVLVYGPGVKANFRSMMKWLSKGIPLPLGAITNKRSLVALDNLVDLIATCIEHPRAANQTFLVSDGEDISTSELLRRMAAALGAPARLLPIPAGLLECVATLLGRRDMARRLCGSLQVDIRKTCELLGWSPPYSVDMTLHKTAEHFLRN